MNRLAWIVVPFAGLALLACTKESPNAAPSSNVAKPGSTAASGGWEGEGGAGGEGGGGAQPIPDGCGDGVATEGEVCDGSDLKGASCVSIGYDEGNLACAPGCKLDDSDCYGVERCTDGIDQDKDGHADCADPDCEAACAGACEAPPLLADPSQVPGTTIGHAADVTPTCGSQAGPGPAVAYEFTATVSGMLDVVLTSLPNLGVSVRASCAADVELGCADATAEVGGEERLSVPIEAGQTVFVMVHGYAPGEAGDYHLSVASRPIVCGDGITDPVEGCDDGNDSSGDGCSASCELEATELEPNDTVGSAQAFAAPWFAAIDPPGDVDVLVVDVPKKASLVVHTFDVGDGACAGGMLDSFVEVLDASGETVLVTDDDGGEGLCSRAIATALEPGEYLVRVSASPLGLESTFPYELAVVVVEDHCGDGVVTPAETCDDANTKPGDGCSATCTIEATEVEPNDDPELANAFAPKWIGVLGEGDADVVSIVVPEAVPGLSVKIGDAGTGACAAGTLDTIVEILAPGAENVLASDDDSAPGYCSYATIDAVPPGTYFVRVEPGAFHTGSMPYEIEIYFE